MQVVEWGVLIHKEIQVQLVALAVGELLVVQLVALAVGELLVV